MKILVDMNLSPSWCTALRARGWEAVHWSDVGDKRALDQDVMSWAREHGYVVFTNDLDFGTALALTQASGPSLIQARTQDLMPARLGPRVVDVLEQHREELEAGALIVIDEARQRVRLLPLK